MSVATATATRRQPWATLAEAVGTCVLVLATGAAICFDHVGGHPLGRVGVAVVSGLVLGGTMFTLRRVSGGHLNPAATLAALVAKRLPLRLGLSFVLSQLAGAGLAGIVLRGIFPSEIGDIHLGTPGLERGGSWAGTMATESLIAFAWVATLGSTTWRGLASRVAPWLVGVVYGLGVLVGGPLTGSGGNPARAFGPAFASGTYSDHGLFWFGPLAGALSAAGLHRSLARRRERTTQPQGDDEPLDSGALYSAAVTLYREGRRMEAAREFARVTELRPEWADPYIYIGIIYRELGDDENARAFLDAALYLRWRNATSDVAARARE